MLFLPQVPLSQRGGFGVEKGTQPCAADDDQRLNEARFARLNSNWILKNPVSVGVWPFPLNSEACPLD